MKAHLSIAIALAGALVPGCALVLGFEDHEPFPVSSGTAGAGGTQSGGGAAEGGGGAAEGGGGGTPGVDVLLIADRTENAIGMYDVSDGTYLGDLVPPLTGTEPYDMSSPNNAAQGPDGMIYVSDQLTDSIVRFGTDGSFDIIFADAGDGLDNVRGIDWRGDILYASNSPGAGLDVIATFDAMGNRQADFITDQGSPFDVFFLPMGTMMFADITNDLVKLYDVDGSSSAPLVTVDFPQQIQPLPNGNFIVAAWDSVVEFEIDGDVARTLPFTGPTRGLYPLENGQWLISWDAGVEAYNPFSGELVSSSRVGTGFSKIERVTLPRLP